MKTVDWAKLVIVFGNAFAGLIAAFPGPEIGVVPRLLCAGIVAGCGAALLFMERVGGDAAPKRRRRNAELADQITEMTPLDRKRLLGELEKRREKEAAFERMAVPHG